MSHLPFMDYVVNNMRKDCLIKDRKHVSAWWNDICDTRWWN
ncbi:putative glutathione peroxidase, Glutathione transferase [Medicago truncatula]|uniref:Putative glutathione peroxidase, Glutathione transferase n=1 Tax=Medicago truncatula TaxID=3880 RepID=A0A396JVY3_MEDTR|nr:putative glutathione peroxidase, Glutathione transferase [Medicago truncatula]